MLCRSGLSGSRRSVRSPPFACRADGAFAATGTGAGGGGSGAGAGTAFGSGAGAAAGCGAGAGLVSLVCCTRFSFLAPIHARMSSGSILPWEPLPVISFGSTPYFCSRARTAGPVAAPIDFMLVSCSSSCCCGGSAACGSASCCCGSVAVAAAASPKVAMTWSVVTSVPSGMSISCSVPSSGAGTSSVTLSVSMSTRLLPRCTLPPGWTCHFRMRARLIDSASVGTFISMIVIVSPKWWCWWSSGCACHAQGFFQYRPLLLPVQRHGAGRGGCRRRT